MIGSEQITRAERLLQVVYRDGIARQLELLKVEAEALDNFVSANIQTIKTHYGELWASVDPRLEPALNTLFVHSFLVGIVAGRHSERGIE